MQPRTIARLVAYGRIGFGSVLVLAPGVLARQWVGSEGDSAGAKTLAAGLGARDLALAAGVLSSLSSGEGTRPWLVASTAADLGDLVATLRARGELPAPSVATVSAIDGGAAVLGAWLSAQDDW